jgi:hypothetical protein
MVSLNYYYIRVGRNNISLEYLKRVIFLNFLIIFRNSFWFFIPCGKLGYAFGIYIPIYIYIYIYIYMYVCIKHYIVLYYIIGIFEYNRRQLMSHSVRKLFPDSRGENIIIIITEIVFTHKHTLRKVIIIIIFAYYCSPGCVHPLCC